jgi:hypothetical protein
MLLSLILNNPMVPLMKLFFVNRHAGFLFVRWAPKTDTLFSEGGVGLVPKRGCLLALEYYALSR